MRISPWILRPPLLTCNMLMLCNYHVVWCDCVSLFRRLSILITVWAFNTPNVWSRQVSVLQIGSAGMLAKSRSKNTLDHQSRIPQISSIFNNRLQGYNTAIKWWQILQISYLWIQPNKNSCSPVDTLYSQIVTQTKCGPWTCHWSLFLNSFRRMARSSYNSSACAAIRSRFHNLLQ